jgi:cholesterol oxidase
MSSPADSGADATLEFTEEMKGYVAFGETDFDAGYRAGREQKNFLMFHLTIAVKDVARFVADPEHVASAAGYVECAALGGTLPVEKGVFNLFVDRDKDVKNMLYRLWFHDGGGSPLTLTGFKVIKDDPGVDIWSDTTTLFTRILRGHVPPERDESAEIAASGIIVIHLMDFVKQLTTFRVTASNFEARVAAATAFGRLFLGALWDMYGSKLVPARSK